MIFTSADLPLSSNTPTISHSDTDATFPTLMSDTPAPPTKPLLSSVPSILFLLKTVLSARAHAGDEWAQMAALSHHAIDLHQVLANAPIPTALLDAASPCHAALYEAALFPSASAFDVPFFSLANLHSLLDNLASIDDFSPSVLVTAFLYVDRLVDANPQLFLTTSNVYLLFAVALMLAIKFNEDGYYTPDYFATLVGLTPKRLAALERDFLTAMAHSLFVCAAQFSHAVVALMAEALDSPDCAAVLSHLQTAHFTDVEAAICRAQDWATFRPVAPRRSPPVWWLSAASSTPAAAAARAASLRDIVRQLATAQLRRDLDVPRGTDPTADELFARTRQLSDRGTHRVYTLLRLAHGADAEVAMPALERLAFEAHTPAVAPPLSAGIWGAAATSPGHASWDGWQQTRRPVSAPVNARAAFGDVSARMSETMSSTTTIPDIWSDVPPPPPPPQPPAPQSSQPISHQPPQPHAPFASLHGSANTMTPHAPEHAWDAHVGSAMSVEPAQSGIWNDAHGTWSCGQPQPGIWTGGLDECAPHQTGMKRDRSATMMNTAQTPQGQPQPQLARAHMTAQAQTKGAAPVYSLGLSMWNTERVDASGVASIASAWRDDWPCTSTAGTAPPPQQQPQPQALPPPPPPPPQPLNETCAEACWEWSGQEWGSQCTVATSSKDQVWGRGWSTEMQQVSTRMDCWAV